MPDPSALSRRHLLTLGGTAAATALAGTAAAAPTPPEKVFRIGVVSASIGGKPQVILLEPLAPREKLNQIKHLLWQHFGVESPNSSALIDNAIAFGHVVSRLTAAASRLWTARGSGQRVLAHFHEWQGGVALPLSQREGQPLVTLFTTHATLLGRYIASSSDDLYQRLIAKIDLHDVSSMFAMEQIKSTTELPLMYASTGRGREGSSRHSAAM